MNDLNYFTKDEDSEITSYGKHNRLLVFYDKKNQRIEVREDDIGLPAAELGDAIKIAMGKHRVHPLGYSLRYERCVLWESVYGLHRTFEFSLSDSKTIHFNKDV